MSAKIIPTRQLRVCRGYFVTHNSQIILGPFNSRDEVLKARRKFVRDQKKTHKDD